LPIQENDKALPTIDLFSHNRLIGINKLTRLFKITVTAEDWLLRGLFINTIDRLQ